MKTKLTLSIDSKILRKAKRDAKLKGKSLSRLFEEKMSGLPNLPDKKRSALLRFKKMFDAAKPTKVTRHEKEWHNHIAKKYG